MKLLTKIKQRIRLGVWRQSTSEMDFWHDCMTIVADFEEKRLNNIDFEDKDRVVKAVKTSAKVVKVMAFMSKKHEKAIQKGKKAFREYMLEGFEGETRSKMEKSLNENGF